MAKISIIIPLYNKEKFIRSTIQSILQQDFQDFEIVIVDDGSKDNSAKIIKSFTDLRIRLVQQRNQGVSAARNRGINEAQGDYIFFLDADDTLRHDALNSLVSAANEHLDAELIVASFVYRDYDGNIIDTCKNIDLGYLRDPFMSIWNKKVSFRTGNILLRKALIDNNVFFNKNLSLYEDLDWLLRLLEKARVFSIEKVVLDYNRYEGGLSSHQNSFGKDYASIALLANCTNKFEKKILANFLFRRALVYLKFRNLHAFKKIIDNNKGYIVYSFCSFLCSIFKSK